MQHSYPASEGSRLQDRDIAGSSSQAASAAAAGHHEDEGRFRSIFDEFEVLRRKYAPDDETLRSVLTVCDHQQLLDENVDMSGSALESQLEAAVYAAVREFKADLSLQMSSARHECGKLPAGGNTPEKVHLPFDVEVHQLPSG